MKRSFKSLAGLALSVIMLVATSTTAFASESLSSTKFRL